MPDLQGFPSVLMLQNARQMGVTYPSKVADGEALPSRLKWRQSWPDKDADFTADASNYDYVGRIYRHSSGPAEGRRLRSLTAFGPEISRNIGNCNGTEDSARAAAHMVEGAWFASIRGGSSLDRPPPTRNAYEMAKAKE